MVLILHPDVNKSPTAHQDFIEINEAYQVLHNPIKRVQYDRLYEYQILKNESEKQKSYKKRHVKWEEHVEKSAKKGVKKGKKRIKNRKKSNVKNIAFDIIFEIFTGIVRLVFEIIFFL